MEKLDSEHPRQSIAEQNAAVNDKHRMALARRAIHGRVEVSQPLIEITDVVLEATRRLGFERVRIPKSSELDRVKR